MAGEQTTARWGWSGTAPRDDAVLPATRALSAFIVPFLVVAFVVLYGFPGDTDRLFAWKIAPPMTPMTLGAVYLGGAYFFVQAFRAKVWHTMKAGFVAVGSFASLMGVATIIHGTASITTTWPFGCGRASTSRRRSSSGASGRSTAAVAPHPGPTTSCSPRSPGW
jgi:hypothetical protein